MACATRRVADPLRFKGRVLFAGSGGGFAGNEQEFRLLENGRLFYRDSPQGTFTLLNSKRKSATAEWFAEMDRLAEAYADYNHPGNRYRFIGHKKDTLEQRIVWGATEPAPPAGITDFYRRFFEFWIPEKKK